MTDNRTRRSSKESRSIFGSALVLALASLACRSADVESSSSWDAVYTPAWTPEAAGLGAAGADLRAGPWTLPALLARAREVAPSGAASAAAVARAGAGLALARSAYGVQLDFDMSVTYTDNPVYAFMGELNAHELDLAGGLADTAWTAHSQAGLHAGYLLWDGGRRSAGESAALHGVEASRLAGAARALGVETQVLGLYMGMRESRALEAAALGRLNAVQGALDAATARLDAGSGLASEVASLEARKAALEEGLLVIRSGEEQQASSLAVLIGGGVGVDLEIDLGSGLGLPELPDSDDVQELVQVAKAARPDLLAANLAVEGNREALRAAELASGPTLSAFGDAWLDGGTPLLRADRGSANVGAALNWNLADGGLREAREAQARAELRATRAALGELVQDVELSVVSAERSVRLADQRFVSASAGAKSSQSALRDLAAGYDAGSITLERWLGAEAAAGAAQARVAQASIQKELARAHLLLTLGISLITTSPNPEPKL